jgi:hypothetical protein
MNATVMTLAKYYARKEVEASILRNLGYPALRGVAEKVVAVGAVFREVESWVLEAVNKCR